LSSAWLIVEVSEVAVAVILIQSLPGESLLPIVDLNEHAVSEQQEKDESKSQRQPDIGF
jgi:hypothetical protein